MCRKYWGENITCIRKKKRGKRNSCSEEKKWSAKMPRSRSPRRAREREEAKPAGKFERHADAQVRIGSVSAAEVPTDSDLSEFVQISEFFSIYITDICQTSE